jgi:hypothetical protein
MTRSIYACVLNPYLCCIMKRLIASVVMIAYMAAAIGFSFSFHYCGGTLHSICFTEDTEEGCCGSKEDSDGCCEDKVISAKYKDDHTPSFASVPLVKVTTDVVLPRIYGYVHTAVCTYTHPVSTYNKGPSPPLLRGIPIYLFIRVLRL